MLVLEDLVYLGRQSTFVFANPNLISGENERKAAESLQTVSLQNFSCIEVMEGIISVIVSWHFLSFERASERAIGLSEYFQSGDRTSLEFLFPTLLSELSGILWPVVVVHFRFQQLKI